MCADVKMDDVSDRYGGESSAPLGDKRFVMNLAACAAICAALYAAVLNVRGLSGGDSGELAAAACAAGVAHPPVRLWASAFE